ncbi:sugar phosphate isomerase/epimerase family protein [Tropicimonas sp. TH_r6]|uniref:sugar phosphate isomerase/epimerase family protein n=1 Tax=Tropicimonas sp. TH_r6 TaxID=3082085 RepID=UPI002952B424|nr:sugar phosphate isomerase/epimerase family protein [Tropicimonas sp. TH_r6]MDV7145580.1 sugar phosphate isomerase/epimerase family protein [Tropicimonas sp. TH_r6]
MSKYRWTRENWPIACAMIPFAPTLPDGTLVQDAPAEAWDDALAQVAEEGFTELDPTDSWMRVADLEPSRLNEFKAVVKQNGLTVPSMSTSRKCVIDPEVGDEMLAYCHRFLDTAAELGAEEVAFGFFGPFTEAQTKELWFWLAEGYTNPDDPATWKLAVERIQELADHAKEVGISIAMEMYEDTYIGTPESAVRFVTDVDRDNVGICADIGNLVRLHRPMPKWNEMLAQVAPFMKYWHVKNYIRDEDPATGTYSSAPVPIEFGIINYREAIRMALAEGFASPILLESYGGDGLSVCGKNLQTLRRILPRA